MNAKRLTRLWITLLLSLAACASRAEVLRVDLSRNTGRSDTAAPHHIEWQFDPAQPARTFDEITVRFRNTTPTGSELRSDWYKFGIDHGALVACDGVFVDSSGALEMIISGLAPGPHTVATFHNSLWRPEQTISPFDVFLNGELALSPIQPTIQVTNDYDIASAYIEFTATAGEDVILQFKPVPGSGAERETIIINGFEIGASDPAKRASKPVPFHGDEHADADNGAATLRWVAGASAVSHHLYFGETEASVAAATPGSSEFQENLSATQWTTPELDPHSTYFWRVDEITSEGAGAKGDVWTFRPRRLAFPGAQGYGRFARGGRGGRVIEVTHLGDSGPGSLRAAVEAEGPRTVIFSVSGLITLESKLIIRNPYLTIASQTAPGKGVCIRKYNLGMLGAHDVIVQHMRVRPGDIASVTLDGMGMASSGHSIIDHCSVSWSIDEAFSSRSAQNITLQRTLISEALNEAGHSNYPPGTQHGYAASISGMIGSFHHNLLAHCAGRNWSLAGGLNQGGQHTGALDIRNNVAYNWKHRTTDGGAAHVIFVNNYYKPGPASTYFYYLNPERNNIAGFGPQFYYVKGNVMEGHCPDGAPIDCGVTEPEPYENFLSRFPFFESHVETQSAREAYKRVLSDVGATQPSLDDHDTRVIDETLRGDFTFRGGKTGLPGLPDSQADVGSWEVYPEERRAGDWDSDRDGLPNWWEQIHQSNSNSEPGDFADSNSDRDGNGFTLLEEYLHWMAEPHLDCIENQAVEIDLSQLTRGFTNQPVHSITSAQHGEAELAPSAAVATFRPAQNFTGLARFEFHVADAEGSSMTRSIGVHVHPSHSAPKLEVKRRGNELELEFQNPAEAEFQVQTSTRLRDWQAWTNLNESLTTLPLGVPELNTQRFFRAQSIAP